MSAQLVVAVLIVLAAASWLVLRAVRRARPEASACSACALRDAGPSCTPCQGCTDAPR